MFKVSTSYNILLGMEKNRHDWNLKAKVYNLLAKLCRNNGENSYNIASVVIIQQTLRQKKKHERKAVKVYVVLDITVWYWKC